MIYHGDIFRVCERKMDETSLPPPLSGAVVTQVLREMVKGPLGPNFFIKQHFKERLLERDLLMGDVLHLFKFGYVYDEAVLSSRPPFYKYSLEGTTPNSEGRTVKIILILPGEHNRDCSLVTIMWKDEER